MVCFPAFLQTRTNRLKSSVLGLTLTCLLALPQTVSAQFLYVDNNQPIDTFYEGVFVGRNESFEPVAGVQTTMTMDGQIGSAGLETVSDSVTTINGGTILGPIFAASQSQITFNSGTFLGSISAIDVAGLTLNGGQFLAPFTALDAGSVTISGGSVSFTTATPTVIFDRNHNYLANTYSVTGTLQNGDVFDQTIIAGDTLTNGANLTFRGAGFATNRVVAGGTQTIAEVYDAVEVIRGSGASPIDLTFTTGANVAQFRLFNDANVTMDGGLFRIGTLRANSQMTITGGEFNTVSVGDMARLTVEGTAFGLSDVITSSLVTVGNGHVEFGGNAFVEIVQMADNSTATITGGSIGTELEAGGNSEATITGGNVSTVRTTGGTANIGGTAQVGFVDVFDGTANLNGGAINGGARVRDGDLVVNGGTLRNTVVVDASGSLTVESGSVDAFIFSTGTNRINGGVIRDGMAVAGGTTTIQGGDLGTGLAFYEGATVNIEGGINDELFGYGGTLNLTGGLVEFTLYNGLGTSLAAFNLFGVFDPLSNPEIGVFVDGATEITGVYWNLNGRLQSGETIAVRYFEGGGSVDGVNGLFFFAVAPEPGSLILILCGGSCLLAIRRHKKHTQAQSVR